MKKYPLITEDKKIEFHLYYRNILDICLHCKNKYKCIAVSVGCYGFSPQKGTYQITGKCQIRNETNHMTWTQCPIILTTYENKVYEITGILLNDTPSGYPTIDIQNVKSAEGIIFPQENNNE